MNTRNQHWCALCHEEAIVDRCPNFDLLAELDDSELDLVAPTTPTPPPFYAEVKAKALNPTESQP